MMVLMVYQHERVHQIIFEDYGIESHIEYIGHGWYWATVTENYSASLCTDACHQAHEINEAITYVLIPLYIMIGGGLLALIGMFQSFLNLMKKINSKIEDGNKENNG